MTVLDDDRLVALFSNAGAAFEVPAGGPDDIVALAQGAVAADDVADSDVADSDVADGDVAEGGVAEDGRGGNTQPQSAGVRRDTVRVVAVARRHKVLCAAATLVVVLLAAGAVGALMSGPSTRPRVSATAPAPSHPAPLRDRSTPTTGQALQNRNDTGGRGQAAAPFFSANAQLGAGSAAGTTKGAPVLPRGVVGQPAKIEQIGTLGLTVGHDDLGQAMTQLMNLAGAYGGFVANSQIQSGTDSRGPARGTVTLQVPVDNFATALKAAQGVGKTSSLSTKATDVTGQYVDLQSRVAALQASRQQYLTIMTKATTVGDVLAVQSQLDTIQNQIDQLQGQLNTLGSETSYAAVTANVSEGTPAARPPLQPEPGFIRAWHDSIGGFVAGVDGVVRVAGPLLFAILCLGVVLAGGRALWRRIQRQRL